MITGYPGRASGSYEKKAAVRAAAFLRVMGLDTHGISASEGVRSDWMEQNGPAQGGPVSAALAADNPPENSRIVFWYGHSKQMR